MKKCAGKCGLVLPNSKFGPNKASTDGLNTRCIECNRIHSAESDSRNDNKLKILRQMGLGHFQNPGSHTWVKKGKPNAVVHAVEQTADGLWGIETEESLRRRLIAQIDARLTQRREAGPRDHTGRTYYDRLPVDNRAWQDGEIQAATEWAARLEALGLTEQAASTVAYAEKKIDSLNEQGQIPAIGGDFPTFTEEGKPLKIEVKLVKPNQSSVQLTNNQGREALKDLNSYGVAWITPGRPVEFAVGSNQLYVTKETRMVEVYTAHNLLRKAA